jgi:hypothetical protein
LGSIGKWISGIVVALAVCTVLAIPLTHTTPLRVRHMPNGIVYDYCYSNDSRAIDVYIHPWDDCLRDSNGYGYAIVPDANVMLVPHAERMTFYPAPTIMLPYPEPGVE